MVSFINLLLPGLFNLAAWMEDYESPSVRTYVAISRYKQSNRMVTDVRVYTCRTGNGFHVSISRNLMLKVSILGVLCYHWLGRVAADPKIIGLKVT